MGTLPLKITDRFKQISSTPEITSRYTDAQKAKLANAAKEFESLMTAMMIKSMTQTTKGMFGDDSFGGDYYDTIFQNQIADYISKNQSIGIAGMLYKKLTGEDLKTAPVAPVSPELNSKVDFKTNLKGAPGIAPWENTPETMPSKSTPEIIPSKSIPVISPLKSTKGITPSTSSQKRLNKYEDIIEKAAETFGVNKNIIKSVILTESAANNNAISGAKAKGLMQLIDSTASEMGVNNIWDPAQNIFGGTKYLAGLLRKYNGDLNLALASYNAGPENVDKYDGIPPFEETQNYVTRVKGYLKHFNGAEDGNE